jgi:hypothetical protein
LSIPRTREHTSSTSCSSKCPDFDSSILETPEEEIDRRIAALAAKHVAKIKG